jgi:hypothetical protein
MGHVCSGSSRWAHDSFMFLDLEDYLQQIPYHILYLIPYFKLHYTNSVKWCNL